MKTYQRIAQLVATINSGNANAYWLNQYEHELKHIMDTMPHGSGLNTDCVLDMERSDDTKLIFNQSFHVMQDGYYTHWIDFRVTITPSLGYDYDIKIVGNFSWRHNQDLKDYIADCYRQALDSEIVEDLNN